MWFRDFRYEIGGIIMEHIRVIEEYTKALELLDAYDHQSITHPEGTEYDVCESLEEAAADLLYSMIKDSEQFGYDKKTIATKFLGFLAWNNALYINGKLRIDPDTLVALVLMIEHSKPEEKELIISIVINCICGGN